VIIESIESDEVRKNVHEIDSISMKLFMMCNLVNIIPSPGTKQRYHGKWSLSMKEYSHATDARVESYERLVVRNYDL
jgi:hypothetical protein